MLEHGLYGESVLLGEGDQPPYPHMVKGMGGKLYHGFRFDEQVVHQRVVDQAPGLESVVGPPDEQGEAYFR